MRIGSRANNQGNDDMEEEDIDDEAGHEEVSISHIIRTFLSSKDTNLDLLPENEFFEAVQSYVEKDSKNAIEDFISKIVKDSEKFLLSDPSIASSDLDHVREIVRDRTAKINELHKQEKLKEMQPNTPSSNNNNNNNSIDFSIYL